MMNCRCLIDHLTGEAISAAQDGFRGPGTLFLEIFENALMRGASQGQSRRIDDVRVTSAFPPIAAV